MTKFELSSKNWYLHTPVSLTTSQHLKAFLISLLVILMIMIFKYCIMKRVNIWKTCIIQWTIISQMGNEGHNKNQTQVNSHSNCNMKQDFDLTKYESSLITVSESTLQLPFKNFTYWVLIVLKKNIHNYLGRLLKELFLLQPYVCIRSDVLHIFQSNQHSKRLNIEVDGNPAVFD